MKFEKNMKQDEFGNGIYLIAGAGVVAHPHRTTWKEGRVSGLA